MRQSSFLCLIADRRRVLLGKFQRVFLCAVCALGIDNAPAPGAAHKEATRSKNARYTEGDVPKMETLVERVCHTAKGEVRLTVLASGIERYIGNLQPYEGRFLEVHATAIDSATGSKRHRTPWREFFPAFPPPPEFGWIADVTLDPATEQIFLCLAAIDRFTVFMFPMDSKPRLGVLPKRPLSAAEVNELVRVIPPELRHCMQIRPPDELMNQYIPGIPGLSIKKEGDNLQVAIPVRGDKPPVIFQYSLKDNQWRVAP